MTAKEPTPMPTGGIRPKAPAAPPNQYNGRDGNGYQPRSQPPEPPPMRIGLNGDTIDRAGVRWKANGKIRTVCTETIVNWFAIACFVSSIAAWLMGAR